MNMGMIIQITRPGMEHSHDPDSATQKAVVRRQLPQSFRGCMEHDRVDGPLVRTSQFPEFSGQGEGHQEITGLQEELLLLSHPFGTLLVLAFWTVAVLAGMVTVFQNATVGTAKHVTAKGLGPALSDGLHHLEVARGHALPVTVEIFRPMAAEDIRHFDHGKPHTRLKVIHDAVDGLPGFVFGALGEMGVNLGGLGGLVSQVLLNLSQVYAIFEQACGVGMSQRADRGLFVDVAQPEGIPEGFLDIPVVYGFG